MQPLHPLHLSLDGRQLIEASAGTGKTYTITGLYLRLLLERELRVEQILVVTYTEAACQELKDKIRQRLLAAQARVAAEGGEDFLDELREHCLAQGGDRERLGRLLARAVLDFDLAAVFTIHGFCRRALQDSAFESGQPFDLELVTDDQELRQQVIDDYWRRESPAWPLVLHQYLAGRDISPDTLPGLLRLPCQALQGVGETALHHGQTVSPAEFSSRHLERLGDIWRRQGGEIRALLLDSPALRRSAETYRPDILSDIFAALEAFFVQGTSSRPPLESLAKLHPAFLEKACKETYQGQPPWHPFFDEVQGLDEELAAAATGLLVELSHHLDRELAALKARGQTAGFDDLLTNLRAALRLSGAGDQLASRLLAQYPVALIDEFQDTDPIQYEIFQTIYRQEGALFLVGDPKQAIYGFRGADIFSYLEAAHQVADAHTLATNWRSEPGLIRAVNSLFASHPAPFVLPGIGFTPVGSPNRSRRHLRLGGPGLAELASLTVLTFPDQEKRAAATLAMATWLAAWLAGLLAAGRRGEAYFDAEGGGARQPLRPGDIALLVRTNDEARLLKEALAEQRISAVTSSNQSVFHTPEAADLGLILEAVAAPGDERLLRRALTTRLLGLDLARLQALEEDEVAWEETLELFAQLHRLWREKGVAVMLRRLLSAHDALPRLAGQGNGERRLTNLRHLQELLQQAAVDQGLGPEGLLVWLAERCRAGKPGEDSLLRLESDENLVQIVTIHKSKGLQYPLVVLPFLWTSTQASNRDDDGATLCHDEEGRLRVDLGSPRQGEDRRRQGRETLAEELRLLYVALTRAENRCLLFWARVKSRSRWLTASSPLQYLLSGQTLAEGEEVVASLTANFCPDDREACLAGLAKVIRGAEGSLARLEAEDLPLPALGPEGQAAASRVGEALVFRRFLRPHLGLKSFTGLHRHLAADSEGPDHDSGAPGQVVARPPQEGMGDMFAFPRGAQAGSCLHAILERHDFQSRDTAATRALVRETLMSHGIDPSWGPAVCQLLERLVALPLARQGGPRLMDVGRADRLDELEFYYPLPAVAEVELLAMLQGAGLSRPAAGERMGFMKGFIDLVFQHQGRYYIVDYKSNYLGETLSDYGQAQLAQAMTQAGYDLQYRIYSVALHRYLGLRLPDYDYERHFGGVFYLFLRGIDPVAGPEFGVHFARPAVELVEGREHD